MLNRRQFVAFTGALSASIAFAGVSQAAADEVSAQGVLEDLGTALQGQGQSPSELFAQARRSVSDGNVVDTIEEDFYRCFGGDFEVSRTVARTDAPNELQNNSVYAAAVGAIYLWFTGKSYVLAAELLGQARVNTRVDSTYSPRNTRHLGTTAAIRNLRGTSVPTTGSSAFRQASGTSSMDGYYAIHRFSYRKSASLVTISDRYDYDDKSNYDSIAGAAVQTMYNAQRLGIIKPFRFSITF